MAFSKYITTQVFCVYRAYLSPMLTWKRPWCVVGSDESFEDEREDDRVVQLCLHHMVYT